MKLNKYTFLIPLSTGGHSGCFHVLAAVTLAGQVSPKDPVSKFSGYIPKTGIAGSYGNSIFNFWRNLPILFHCGCTIYCTHKHCTRFSIFHIFQHLLFSVLLLFYNDYPDSCKVISRCICISLMIDDVEHILILGWPKSLFVFFL